MVNTIYLCNTRYMNLTLASLRSEGFEIADEDVEHLSSLATSTQTCSDATTSPFPKVCARARCDRYVIRKTSKTYCVTRYNVYMS